MRAAANGVRAMDVADLVTWVYRDQKAHLLERSGVGAFEARLSGGGLTMTAVVGRSALLGCSIDGGGFATHDLHPVAEAVDRHLQGMSGGALLRRYGIRGTVPEGSDLDWRFEPLWKEAPVFDPATRLPRRGSFIMQYNDRKQPVLCFVQPDHEERYVDDRRAEFLAWYAGLVRLSGWAQNASALAGWRISGPAFKLPSWVHAPAWRLKLANMGVGIPH